MNKRNFTTKEWCALSVKEQIEKSSAYQVEYARINKLEIEKKLNGITFCLIPPGKFWMGSSESRLRKIINKPFYMAQTQVTQSQWEAVMGNNPSYYKGSNLPVESVSWDDCKSFCDKTGLLLPTEVQWEYACRAGVTTAYNIGNSINTSTIACFQSKCITVEGGTLPNKNAWGLYDMHGNVWEWCIDNNFSKFINNFVDYDELWKVQINRSFRGGAYNTTPLPIGYDRDHASQDYLSRGIGFRPIVPI